ncbi:hypothetical protein Tco_1094593 [Tanacetum coccineum]|uniref:MAK10-like protein n=1 Tax=Tanacetum coccineum TaxID=301880 RepID=A0ABQ5IH50_9ASTR
MGDENHIRTLGDYSKPSHKGYKNTIELPVGNNMVPLRSDTIRLVQNGCSFHGLRSEDPNKHLKDFLKLMDSLNLDEDLALYDNESWNNPRDFAKSVKAIALPQDVLSTSDRHLIELENQVQRLMKAYLAPTQPEILWLLKALQQSAMKKRRNSGRKESKAHQNCSPQNISPASIKELNKNLSAPKRIHFVNSIIILSTDSDMEEYDSSTNARDLNLGGMVKGKEGVKEQDKEENEMETDMEVDE